MVQALGAITSWTSHDRGGGCGGGGNGGIIIIIIRIIAPVCVCVSYAVCKTSKDGVMVVVVGEVFSRVTRA